MNALLEMIWIVMIEMKLDTSMCITVIITTRSVDMEIEEQTSDNWIKKKNTGVNLNQIEKSIIFEMDLW